MSASTTEIEKLISAIATAFNAGSFKNYVDYIRFPFYKNLELDSKIDFNFPLTVLVGPNGSGKSSALQAIYGMPEGKSPGHFWFSTNVDPIEDDEQNRACLIYGYKDDQGVLHEVLKTRIGKAKGAHYWEPSRPLKKYGMSPLGDGSRSPTVKKKVEYLDFRSELSAYDKFFYFSSFNVSKTFKSKQDSIRYKSKHLRHTIDDDKPRTYHKRKIEKPTILDSKSLAAVNQILGKEYVECKLINHNLYSSIEGLTIYFRTNSLNYSEAFAGRGEFAVVRLVNQIVHAEKYSLILLDEPEVSLHPGAQEKLLEFLLKQTLEKKLQVVLSTHSPKFVQFLPENAIKLFLPSTNSRFRIKNQCHYVEVFRNIGQETDTEKRIIYVEDYLSKTILDAIISDLNNEFGILFTVNILPGGADTLLTKAASFSQEDESKKFILLDGDKYKIKYDVSAISLVDSQSFEFIDSKILEVTGRTFKSLGFAIDSQGISRGDEGQKIKFGLQFLKYAFKNLDYFPANKIPEDLIWDQKLAIKLLTAVQCSPIPNFSFDSKENIRLFTESFACELTQESYHTCCKLFVTEFVKNKNADYDLIKDILTKFKS